MVALLSAAIATLFRRSYTPASDLGISPNNTAVQNRDAFLSLSETSEYVVLPAGDYLFDNTPQVGEYALIVTDFSGRLRFEAGARIVFTNDMEAGLWFEGGSGTIVECWRSTFRTLPSVRTGSKYCLNFRSVTEPLVKDCKIDGSGSIGLMLEQCIRPRIEGARIASTMADGLHLANCQDAYVENVTTQDTGDDGIAITNFARRSDFSGIHATNITVIRAGARGIVVGGQRDVTIENFEVDISYSAGVLILYEAPRDPVTGDYYWITRTPSNVRLAHGAIRNAGSGLQGTGASMPQGDGIYCSNVGSVELRNIEVSTPDKRGVTVYAGEFSRVLSSDDTIEEPKGIIRMTDIEVHDAPGEGFMLEGGTYNLDNLTVNLIGGCGFRAYNSKRVTYGKLETVDVSQNDSSRRAFDFEQNEQINGMELYVTDTQNTSTGYRVSVYGEQSGNLGTVYDRIEKGEVVIENASNLKFTRE